MEMSDQGIEGDPLLQYVILFATCPDCHGSYTIEDVQAVKRRGSALWVVLKCPHCGSERVIVAYAQESEDAEPAEIENTTSEPTGADGSAVGRTSERNRTPITEEEVRRWRDFLASFDGDMKALLGER